MTYDQTISYLYSRLPLFSRVGAAAYKDSLHNIIELTARLGRPQDRFRTVHVAGTNGKGSVSHMLAAVFQSAGYRTGLSTSPHLKDYRERIKIDGEWISRQFVIDFTERIKPEIERLQPSFFEINVAMAFSYFEQQKVDIAIIETGLGGRLDSTNIIHPDLAVITNIGMDHMAFLGDSLGKIAYEKAGIIKKDTPAVIGEVLPETISVFQGAAQERNAELILASHIRQAMNWKWEAHELIVEVARQHHTTHQTYHLDLTGIYQVKNLVTVLAALDKLHALGWNITEHHIHQGLGKVKKLTGLHGRWEVIQQFPLVVLDVAHNEDGIRQLVQQIEVMDYSGLHLILGMVRDKEVDKVLSYLPPSANYYFTQAEMPRALEGSALAGLAAGHGLKGEVFPNVNLALQEAKRKAGRNDLIVICGSVFLVGEVEV